MRAPTAQAEAGQVTAAEPLTRADSGAEHPVVEDLLIEEVSIDGMCGVY